MTNYDENHTEYDWVVLNCNIDNCDFQHTDLSYVGVAKELAKIHMKETGNMHGDFGIAVSDESVIESISTEVTV